MAKKKKKKKPNKNSVRRKPKAPESGKKSRIPLIALIAGSVLVIIGAYYLYQIKKPPSRSPQLAQVQKETGSLREKRQTLSPHGFTGKVSYYIDKKAPPDLVFQMNLLADYTFFCGTGRKTTVGMGQTVRL